MKKSKRISDTRENDKIGYKIKRDNNYIELRICTFKERLTDNSILIKDDSEIYKVVDVDDIALNISEELVLNLTQKKMELHDLYHKIAMLEFNIHLDIDSMR